MALVLELTSLAAVTDDGRFHDAADRVVAFMEVVQTAADDKKKTTSTTEKPACPACGPNHLDLRNLDAARYNVFSVSCRSATVFETLPAMHLLTAAAEERHQAVYNLAAEAMEHHLLWRSMVPGARDDDDDDDVMIFFPGTLYTHPGHVDLIAQAAHAGCAVGTVFAVGARVFNRNDHLSAGEKLVRSWVWPYGQFATGLMPNTLNMAKCPGPARCEWDEREWLDPRRDPSLKEGFTYVPDRSYRLSGPRLSVAFSTRGGSPGGNTLRTWRLPCSSRRRGRRRLLLAVVDGDTAKLDLLEVGDPSISIALYPLTSAAALQCCPSLISVSPPYSQHAAWLGKQGRNTLCEWKL